MHEQFLSFLVLTRGGGYLYGEHEGEDFAFVFGDWIAVLAGGAFVEGA
jgi:hypothetical protein